MFSHNFTVFFFKMLFSVYCGFNSLKKINYERNYSINKKKYINYYFKIKPKYNNSLFLFPFKYNIINIPL